MSDSLVFHITSENEGAPLVQIREEDKNTNKYVYMDQTSVFFRSTFFCVLYFASDYLILITYQSGKNKRTVQS